MAEVPEHLLRRSQERRKALGLPVPGEEGGEGEAASEAAPAAETPAEGAVEAAAAASDAPAARRRTGRGRHDRERRQDPGAPARARQAPAGRDGRRRSGWRGRRRRGRGGAATATIAPPAPTATGPGGHTQRLLTVVKSGSIQQTRAEAQDKVHVWPHLLVIEFASILILLAAVTIFSAVVRAPLLSLADVNKTPNPSKAPWYFLGLQELLTMFHPMVAGVTIPGVGLGLLAVAPYVDKNPSQQAERSQVRDRDLHDVHHALGGARHHRFVLPGAGVQLHLPLEGRDLLRAVGAGALRGIHHRRHRRGARRSGRVPPRDRPPACDHRSAEPGDAPSATRRRRRPRRYPTSPPTAGASEGTATDESARARADEAAARPRVGRRTRPSPPAAAAVVKYVPVDEEELGVTRRQFFNRGILTATVLGIGAFGAASLAFLWPSGAGGFGGKVNIGSLDDIDKAIDGQEAVLQRGGEGLHPAVPEGRHPEGQEGLARTCRRSSPGWSRATSRCTRSACTSGAASPGARPRSGSSARATVRSTTGSARSAVARRPAASTASPSASSGGSMLVDTGDGVPGSPHRDGHDRSGSGGCGVRVTRRPVGQGAATTP